MSEQITTAEELDALPVGSVVLDRHGDSWQRVDDTERRDEDGMPLRNVWASVAWLSDRTSREMFSGLAESIGEYAKVGPLTLLYRPDAPVTADGEFVRGGVCLLCGGGVLSSGEHIDLARHAAEVERITAGATVTEWGVRCDRGIMERICIHGIGHYDWDQWEYHKSIGAELEVVHVCDFCCREHERAVVT